MEAACLAAEEAEGEEDAELERAVQAAGGVAALVGMAAKHADSGAVQAQFAGVLRDLCISDEIALEIHQAAGGAAPQPYPYPWPEPGGSRWRSRPRRTGRAARPRTAPA